MNETLIRQSRRFHTQLFAPAYPVPSFFQIMAFRMSRTSMKLTLGGENRDYIYYRDHGWFDSGYYYKTGLGPLKKAIGATFDWMAARMFKHREAV